LEGFFSKNDKMVEVIESVGVLMCYNVVVTRGGGLVKNRIVLRGLSLWMAL